MVLWGERKMEIFVKFKSLTLLAKSDCCFCFMGEIAVSVWMKFPFPTYLCMHTAPGHACAAQWGCLIPQ